MGEPGLNGAAPADAEYSKLLAELERLGPDDARPEVDVLADLDRVVDAMRRKIGQVHAEARADHVAGDIARLRESALDPQHGQAALGKLAEAITARKKFLGLEAPEVAPAAERVLERIGAPPLVHVPTGLRTLDQITRGGLLSSQLHLIAGEPDAGKTAMLVQIGLAQAKTGRVVALHCIDERRRWIEDRIGQAHGLFLDDLEANKEGPLAYLAGILRNLPNLILVGREDRFTAEDTAEAALALARRLGAPGVSCCFDSLQKTRCRAEPARGTARIDPREQIEMRVEALLDIALRGPLVIATSEVARSAYRARSVKDRSAEMAAAKGSGSIEYAVTTELVLSRIGKGEHAGRTRVGVPKNKRGEKGLAFVLDRDPDKCTFEDLGRIDAGDDGPEPEARKKPPGDINLEPYCERVRKALAGMPRGFAGSRDDLARLAGGKATHTRTAIALLLTRNELVLERTEGQPPRLRMRSAADPTTAAEEPQKETPT